MKSKPFKNNVLPLSMGRTLHNMFELLWGSPLCQNWYLILFSKCLGLKSSFKGNYLVWINIYIIYRIGFLLDKVRNAIDAHIHHFWSLFFLPRTGTGRTLLGTFVRHRSNKSSEKHFFFCKKKSIYFYTLPWKMLFRRIIENLVHFFCYSSWKSSRTKHKTSLLWKNIFTFHNFSIETWLHIKCALRRI